MTGRTLRSAGPLPLVGLMVAVLGGLSPAAAGGMQGKIAAQVAAYEKMSPAVVGVSVIDLRNGKEMVGIRPGQLRIPASNQKILTSASALVRLGGDFNFTTSLYRIGRDVVIIGDYDPTLGDPRLARQAGESIYAELDRWALAIKHRVGTTLPGRIVLCARTDSYGYRHPNWQTAQHSRWYAAPIAHLNFNNNCFDVTFRLAGGRAEALVEPKSRFIRVTSSVKPGRRHLWSLRTNEDDSAVIVTGTVKTSTDEPVSVAVNNPPMLLGRVLADRLERAGVAFAGEITLVEAGDIDLAGAVRLCGTARKLATVMKRANTDSLNMAAECMFLRAGDGSWHGSAKITSDTLVRSFHLSPASLVVSDGSGLSRANRVTPRAMTKVLAGLARRGDAGILLDSLSVCGVEGTLKKRLRAKPYKGRVLGKTGYISGVSALSGYVLDRTGQPAVAFSILVNRLRAGTNWKAKQLQDTICRMLVDSL